MELLELPGPPTEFWASASTARSSPEPIVPRRRSHWCHRGGGGCCIGGLGRARATGFELEAGAQIGETLHAQAAYTYVKSTDRTRGSFNEGTDLARRPRHALTTSLDWTPIASGPLTGLMLGGDIRLVGDSYDFAGEFGRLDSYALATVRASVPVGEHVEVFGRIENVTNEDYVTAGDYGAAGRS